MRHRNKMRFLPIVVLLLAVAGGMAVNAKQSLWDKEAQKRKADYIYLESQNQDQLDNNDANFELLRESFYLNPDDKAVGFDFGAAMLGLSQADSVSMVKSLALMADYFNDNPSDLEAGGMYGMVTDYLGMYETGVTVWEKLHQYHPENPQVTMSLIKDLMQLQDSLGMQRAVNLYDTLYISEGEDPGIFVGKMKLLYYLDDTTRMVKEIESLLSKPGGANKTNFLIAGDVYDAVNKNDLALEYFKKAYAADTTDGSTSYRLANFYLSKGDSASYDREIIKAMMSPNMEVDIKTELLRDYVGTHVTDTINYDNIEKIVRRVVDMHPREGGLRYLYFGLLTILDRKDEAIEQLRYMLDANPDQRDQWAMLVQMYDDKGNHVEAINTLTDALRYFPDDEHFFYIRGIEYSMIKDYDNALADFINAEKVSDGEHPAFISSVYCSMGDLYSRMDNIDAAFEAYEKSLELDPDNSFALNNYSYLLACEQKDLDKALKMADKARALDGDNLNNIDTYAWVQFQMKDYPGARETFDSAIDRILGDPNATYEAFEHAGDIYFMTGEADQAVAFWQQALKLNPDSPILQKKVTHKTYFFK